MCVAKFFLFVVYTLLLFIVNMETEDNLKQLRALGSSELFQEEPFGMSKHLNGDLHRSLRGSFVKCYSFSA